MGYPSSAFFQVDVKKAIIIGCKKYEQLRIIDGKQNFKDIPETQNDIKVVYAGLRRLKFEQSDIVILRDPKYPELKIAIDQLSADIYRNQSSAGLNTLVFVYYAGHGMMDNSTYCVLNEAKMYPLEKMLRCLAKAKGSYVISVFDCCREDMRRYQPQQNQP